VFEGTDPAPRAPCPVPERVDDGKEAFQREGDEAVRRRHEHPPERHLGEPETTECFVSPVARRQASLVVLQQSGQEEERGYCGVDQALVDNVQVCDTLPHRMIAEYDDDDENVGQEPERTCTPPTNYQQS